MKWIGLTGGLASGKSTVAGMLRTKGWPVIDADDIARRVVAPGTPGQTAVLREFGADLRGPDGELDRRELGRRVFGDGLKLSRLESLIHPLVQAEVASRRRLLSTQGFRMAFYDVPLLFEKKLEGFDAVVVVSATPDLQRSRMKSRNAWDDAEIDRRLASQLPLLEKESLAHFVLRNDGDLAHLERQVDELILKL
ncbi:MAG: dephospho-CoA kinase [Bdellovibrionaceae bacterium]|nr:dephospho-CoA kinase [Pseudobdellovibrionaceae bacterium]MBX3032527.1 dephospho-CoA kinase [Pseudobdellovibrionaceae bacterium]